MLPSLQAQPSGTEGQGASVPPPMLPSTGPSAAAPEDATQGAGPEGTEEVHQTLAAPSQPAAAAPSSPLAAAPAPSANLPAPLAEAAPSPQPDAAAGATAAAQQAQQGAAVGAEEGGAIPKEAPAATPAALTAPAEEPAVAPGQPPAAATQQALPFETPAAAEGSADGPPATSDASQEAIPMDVELLALAGRKRSAAGEAGRPPKRSVPSGAGPDQRPAGAAGSGRQGEVAAEPAGHAGPAVPMHSEEPSASAQVPATAGLSGAAGTEAASGATPAGPGGGASAAAAAQENGGAVAAAAGEASGAPVGPPPDLCDPNFMPGFVPPGADGSKLCG